MTRSTVIIKSPIVTVIKAIITTSIFSALILKAVNVFLSYWSPLTSRGGGDP